MVVMRVQAGQQRPKLPYAQQAFAGKDWPIDRMAMAALLDLGLSSQHIARYFAINRNDVIALQNFYGLS